MKNWAFLSLLSLIFINGFSQNFGFEPNGALVSKIKKEKLNSTKLLGEIIPDYPSDYYAKTLDYVSVEISGVCNGTKLASKSVNDTLTTEQKNILRSTDISSEIFIKINFKYKDAANDGLGSNNKIKEMECQVSVVPEVEAEFPGGYGQMKDYLNKTVISKISQKSPPEIIPYVSISFTINEEGDIDPKIYRASPDQNINNIVLEAFNKMPKWKPAKNSKGETIKQKFIFSIGKGGC